MSTHLPVVWGFDSAGLKDISGQGLPFITRINACLLSKIPQFRFHRVLEWTRQAFLYHLEEMVMIRLAHGARCLEMMLHNGGLHCTSQGWQRRWSHPLPTNIQQKPSSTEAEVMFVSLEINSSQPFRVGYISVFFVGPSFCCCCSRGTHSNVTYSWVGSLPKIFSQSNSVKVNDL